jgi:arginyl-tRNA synthetase
LGTAVLRFEDYDFDGMLYITGNEQNHHFRQLFALLKRLGHPWWERLEHLGYGMVNLPAGKLKSREGQRVDADDLLDEMRETARTIMETSAKRRDFTPEEADQVAEQVGQGALKFYLLRVSAAQDILYDPEKSVDMAGVTGPYVQYAQARTASLLTKSGYRFREAGSDYQLDGPTERELLLQLLIYPQVVRKAAADLNPSRLALYLYDLARAFNKFWNEVPILREEEETLRQQRLALVAVCGKILRRGLSLLGIESPERI